MTSLLTNDCVRTLVAAAAAAPSIHNTQPWRFRLAPDTRTVEVHAVPRRALPLTDPDTRALHVSAGAALCNLQAAAIHLGREPVGRLRVGYGPAGFPTPRRRTATLLDHHGSNHETGRPTVARQPPADRDSSRPLEPTDPALT